MRVLLAGGSGAIGLPLIAQLRQAGHEVTAIHKNPDGGPRLERLGAAPLQVDVLDRSALLRAVVGQSFDAVISKLTSLKKAPFTRRRLAMTDRLRVEGTANLLAAAQSCGARRFITQSMPARVLVLAPYAREAMAGNLRVSNAKAKNELGWTPMAPTYREGIKMFAEHYRQSAGGR